jgi:hypothetical protein
VRLLRWLFRDRLTSYRAWHIAVALLSLLCLFWIARNTHEIKEMIRALNLFGGLA